MPKLSRPTASLLIAAVLLIALDGWTRLAVTLGHTPPAALGRLFLHETLERQAAVRDRVAATAERRSRSRELAVEVVQGRLTLREGAARLREVYRADPGFPWAAVEQKFPGASDEERCCRLLIGEMKGLGGADGERARAVAQRLEAGLQDELRQGRHTLRG